jgi:hypothetical protein
MSCDRVAASEIDVDVGAFVMRVVVDAGCAL